MRGMKWLVAAGAAVALSGCGLLFDVGKGPRASDYFTGRAAELAGAIRSLDSARIADLIGGGADVEASGEDGMTMLQYAVEVDSLPGVEALLAAGADPDRTGYGADAALHLAAGDAELAQALIDGGADPDVRNAQTGSTPLTSVCLALDPEGFEVLAAAGADVNLVDNLGDLALHTCARTNQGAILLRMLELGADPEALGGSGASFQDYYFGYQRKVLNDRAVAERRAVVGWLDAHGIPLVPAAGEYR